MLLYSKVDIIAIIAQMPEIWRIENMLYFRNLPWRYTKMTLPSHINFNQHFLSIADSLAPPRDETVPYMLSEELVNFCRQKGVGSKSFSALLCSVECDVCGFNDVQITVYFRLFYPFIIELV